MPWFTDIKSAEEFSSFASHLSTERALVSRTLGHDHVKSLGSLLGAWGCTYAIEGKEPPNRFILFTFNVWKKHPNANVHILLAEFVLGFCKSGPLSGRGNEIARFLQATPAIGDRTYEHYQIALRNAAKAGVSMATLGREVIELRKIIEDVLEPPWQRLLQIRLMERRLESQGLVEFDKAGVTEGLKSLRAKQKSKLEGKANGLFGAAEHGQFLLIHEAKDGSPLLLLSSSNGAPVKHEKEALALMSGKGEKLSKGYWKQTRNHKTVIFAVTADKGGGMGTVSLFQLALVAMGATRSVILGTLKDMNL